MAEELVRATANLRLGFHCCDFCCLPRFFFKPGDPSEAELSALSKRKFYVVKKGAPGTEAIYSHWDLAQPHVTRISNALHESCATATAEEARQIWARYCHNNHTHPPALATTGTISPPPYTPVTPPRSPQASAATSRMPRADSRRYAVPPTSHVPATPPQVRFYRVSGSPRVLIHAAAAEAELRDSGGTASLLVGTSLADVEDDDEVSVGDTPHFYRVFGSPRVQSSRDAALAELADTQADGLLSRMESTSFLISISLGTRGQARQTRKKKPRGTSIESNKLPTNYEHLRITTTGASHADLISPLSKPQPRPRSSQAATGVGTQAGSLRRVKQFYNQERVGTHAGSGSEGALEER
ncbi:hypothetical protein B0H14DRAFT_2593075 [Mycena olivaceomarginata]|nr:hypothetical protein B0H14DRAFT_2593075 [Mycena olivaceomarginata]